MGRVELIEWFTCKKWKNKVLLMRQGILFGKVLLAKQDPTIRLPHHTKNHRTRN
jgi:hypothetical protein